MQKGKLNNSEIIIQKSSQYDMTNTIQEYIVDDFLREFIVIYTVSNSISALGGMIF